MAWYGNSHGHSEAAKGHKTKHNVTRPKYKHHQVKDGPANIFAVKDLFDSNGVWYSDKELFADKEGLAKKEFDELVGFLQQQEKADVWGVSDMMNREKLEQRATDEQLQEAYARAGVSLE